MLDVSALSFQYEDLSLLEEISFTVNRGELFHIHGENGTGKTTLLRLLAGLLQPCEGEIRYQGRSIYAMETSYSQSICYIGHRLGIHPLLTVRENCQVDPHYRSNFKQEEALCALNLTGLEEIPCKQLSTGQQRRVSLLRLFITRAPVWILDEPLVGLDLLGIQRLMQLFEKHLNQKGILIVTSHQSLPVAFSSERHFFIDKLAQSRVAK